MGNRPDCAYFLLLGLCGAAFLLTIGGILTYIAFNPGSIDAHPHSALSHIPHFHHHTSKHVGGNSHHHYPQQQQHHPPPKASSGEQSHHHNNEEVEKHNNKEKPLEDTSPTKNNKNATIPTFPTATNSTTGRSTTTVGNTPGAHEHLGINRNSGHKSQPESVTSSSSSASMEAYEAKAKQSLALAIIGPLCLLMGIVVTLIVGVLALKYDCDHEPEPNIAFLRLRSEMSLNFDPDKNNYELLRPSSSIDQAGGQYSINPTGLPRC